jgi:hypothetical protein
LTRLKVLSSHIKTLQLSSGLLKWLKNAKSNTLALKRKKLGDKFKYTTRQKAKLMLSAFYIVVMI